MLTARMLDDLFARLMSPEFQENERRVRAERAQQLKAAWEEAKRRYARRLGVETLSIEQVDKLSDIVLEQQLAMRGLTLKDLDEFFGVE